MRNKTLMTGFDVEQVLEQLTTTEKNGVIDSNDLWNTYGSHRLGVPSLRFSDGPTTQSTIPLDGASRAVSPCGRTPESAFDNEVLNEADELAGVEAKYKNSYGDVCPATNIQRGVLVSRGFGSFHGDPYLTDVASSRDDLCLQSQQFVATRSHCMGNSLESARDSSGSLFTSPTSRQSSTAFGRNRRSRNGCLECRKRRTGCDEIKPCCTRCSKKGLQCKYQFKLKFKEDYDLRGIMFGREGLSYNEDTSKKSGINTIADFTKLASDAHYQAYPDGSAFHFINAQIGTFHHQNGILGPRTLYPTSFIPFDVKEHLSSQTDSYNYALSYYMERVAPIFTPLGVSGVLELSPGCSVKLSAGLDLTQLIRYSQSHTNVFQILLAVGAGYLGNMKDMSNRQYWTEEGKRFRKGAMKRLQRKFQTLELGTGDKSTLNEILISTFLLCLYDLANDCHENWSSNIKIASALISEFPICASTEMERKLLSFVCDFFVYQESMGRTVCKKTSIFTPELTELGDSKDTRGLTKWTGCNFKLVEIISDITDLSYERALPSEVITPTNFMEMVSSIEENLESLKLQVPNNLETSEEFCFLLGCETKRIATRLYLHCSILNKTPKDRLVTQLVAEIHGYLKTIIQENGYMWSFLIWPLFIMACAIDPWNDKCDQLRYFVLECFDMLENKTLGNVNKTRQIIIDLWNKRDLSTSGNERLNKSCDGNGLLGSINDWEFYVADKGLNISLG